MHFDEVLSHGQRPVEEAERRIAEVTGVGMKLAQKPHPTCFAEHFKKVGDAHSAGSAALGGDVEIQPANTCIAHAIQDALRLGSPLQPDAA